MLDFEAVVTSLGAKKMISKEFVTAGKAIFTVKSVTGEHYTFQVNKKEASDRYRETFFVSLLTGPDNTSDYTYMGMLNPMTFLASPTRASKLTTDSKPFKVLDWALTKIWNNSSLPEGYEIYHEGRCCRCGRLLTVPESIESGIGPECAKIMGLVGV